MLRKFLFLSICFVSTLNLACSTAQSPNANANMGNAVNLDPANLPPGFSTSPIPMNGNMPPGIPNPNDPNANVSTSNIPGISDANKMGKTPQTKKTPPIPGIPDEETLKKQMNTPLKDVNIVNNPPKEQRPDNRPPDKKRPDNSQ